MATNSVSQPGMARTISHFSLPGEPGRGGAAHQLHPARHRGDASVAMHNSRLKIAEDAATADILRPLIGNRRRLRHRPRLDHAATGIPQEESRETHEALTLSLALGQAKGLPTTGNTSTRILYVIPRPLQQPYPRVRIAANSPDTFPFASRRRFRFSQPADQSARPSLSLSGGLISGVAKIGKPRRDANGNVSGLLAAIRTRGCGCCNGRGMTVRLSAWKYFPRWVNLSFVSKLNDEVERLVETFAALFLRMPWLA